jgi:23S rRNA pseudouridine1911/1915/1917 synthase
MSREAFQFIYDGEPARLDRVVVAKLAASHQCSRSQVERWIELGCVSVNGAQVRKPAYKLSPGDRVEVVGVDEPTTQLAPYDFPLEILFEDDHLLVINKPAGLSMHPGAGNRKATLANAVVQHVGSKQLAVGESDRPGIVHRLDKDTTGVVVVAKTVPVHAALARQFADRSAGRTYVALVFTTPRAKRPVQQSEQGEVNAPLGRHPTRRTMMAVVEQGKRAVTRWATVERFPYGTLLECRLETGRTHQIRVHMNSIGCPVVGDTLYGDFSNLPLRLQEAATRFGRQALHAATLAFSHPVTGERLSFSAPLPSDFQDLLGVFRNFS